jgi:hypothetical protein
LTRISDLIIIAFITSPNSVKHLSKRTWAMGLRPGVAETMLPSNSRLLSLGRSHG